MPAGTYAPCTRRTMFFIGVTTGQSSIHRIFPRWAALLGLGECELRGIDFPLDAPAEDYRRAIAFIKDDPLALGALVTTHKMHLFAACRDQFDEIEPLAADMAEVSSIYKRGSRLHARAVDPHTSGITLATILPPEHWHTTRTSALILGAGGSALSLAWHLCAPHSPATSRPAAVHVTDIHSARLQHLRHLHQTWQSPVPLHCHHVARPEASDAVCSALPAGSLVVNATGLGKDAPGSPLSPSVQFPLHACVWEFNYRGPLPFLQQARAQQAARHLTVHDGWTYFLHGWTTVIADIFQIHVPSTGPLFDQLSAIAVENR